MESIDWLTEKGIDFNRGMVDIAVGALWRRAHKPNRPKGVEFVDKLQKHIIAQGVPYHNGYTCKRSYC